MVMADIFCCCSWGRARRSVFTLEQVQAALAAVIRCRAARSRPLRRSPRAPRARGAAGGAGAGAHLIASEAFGLGCSGAPALVFCARPSGGHAFTSRLSDSQSNQRSSWSVRLIVKFKLEGVTAVFGRGRVRRREAARGGGGASRARVPARRGPGAMRLPRDSPTVDQGPHGVSTSRLDSSCKE